MSFSESVTGLGMGLLLLVAYRGPASFARARRFLVVLLFVAAYAMARDATLPLFGSESTQVRISPAVVILSATAIVALWWPRRPSMTWRPLSLAAALTFVGLGGLWLALALVVLPIPLAKGWPVGLGLLSVMMEVGLLFLFVRRMVMPASDSPRLARNCGILVVALTAGALSLTPQVARALSRGQTGAHLHHD